MNHLGHPEFVDRVPLFALSDTTILFGVTCVQMPLLTSLGFILPLISVESKTAFTGSPYSGPKSMSSQGGRGGWVEGHFYSSQYADREYSQSFSKSV